MKQKFKTKPLTFEAIMFTGDNSAEIIKFINGDPDFKILEGNIIFMLSEHKGWFLKKHDYVVKKSNGRFTVTTWEDVNFNYIPIND